MSWRIERKPWYVAYRPWEYEYFLSSYGLLWGRAWTRRRAERALMRQNSEWFAGG